MAHSNGACVCVCVWGGGGLLSVRVEVMTSFDILLCLPTFRLFAIKSGKSVSTELTGCEASS
jgi:hypothetical protein